MCRLFFYRLVLHSSACEEPRSREAGPAVVLTACKGVPGSKDVASSRPEVWDLKKG